MLSKKQRIFKKTICDSFLHFPQILRDAVKTRSELVRRDVHELNYGTFDESWQVEMRVLLPWGTKNIVIMEFRRLDPE